MIDALLVGIALSRFKASTTFKTTKLRMFKNTPRTMKPDWTQVSNAAGSVCHVTAFNREPTHATIYNNKLHSVT